MRKIAFLLANLMAILVSTSALANEPDALEMVIDVDRSGNLLSWRFAQHAKVGFRERQAVDTMMRAQPFLPLPEGAADHEEFRVRLKFTCTHMYDVTIQKDDKIVGDDGKSFWQNHNHYPVHQF